MTAEVLPVDLVLRGALPRSLPKPTRRNEAGRRCGHPECSTVLSIYNTDDHCSLHQQARPQGPVRPGRRPAADRVDRVA